MSLENITLTASAAPIYACANPDGTSVSSINLTNYSGSNVTVSLHACPGGEVASNENLILKNLDLDPDATFNYTEAKLLLDNGDDIKAIASAGSSVAATVSVLDF